MKLESFLANIFLVLLLFPYVTFGLPSYSDSQPWAAIYGSGMLLLYLSLGRTRGIDLNLFWLVLVAVFCIILNVGVLLFADNYRSLDRIIIHLRYIFKYFAFISIVPAARIFFERFNTKILKASIVLWWMIATSQFILKKPIIEFLLPRAGYNVSRSWVIGFAPEAGYLAKTSLFFLLLIDAFSIQGRMNKKEAIILKFLCFWMILLSYSLTGFFLLLVYILASVFLSNNLKKIARMSVKKLIIVDSTILLIFGAVPFVLNFMAKIMFTTQGRLWSFLRNVHETGSLIAAFFGDPSFKARFSHITRSLAHLGVYGDIPDYITGSLSSPLVDSGLFGLLFVHVVRVGKTSDKTIGLMSKEPVMG